MYIRYRLSNGTMVKVYEPEPMSVREAITHNQKYNELVLQVRHSYTTGKPFECGYTVTMVEETL